MKGIRARLSSSTWLRLVAHGRTAGARGQTGKSGAGAVLAAAVSSGLRLSWRMAGFRVDRCGRF